MTYISFNFANMVTITLIALVGFGLLALIEKGVVNMQNKQGA